MVKSDRREYRERKESKEKDTGAGEREKNYTQKIAKPIL